MIAALISEGTDYVTGIKNVYARVKAHVPMLLLTEDSIIAARDKYGRTPIIVGQKDGAHAITSETCAFPNLGYDVCYNLGPAEIVEVKADGITKLKEAEKTMQICAFLWTYYGYPYASMKERMSTSCVTNQDLKWVVTMTLKSISSARCPIRELEWLWAIPKAKESLPARYREIYPYMAQKLYTQHPGTP